MKRKTHLIILGVLLFCGRIAHASIGQANAIYPTKPTIKNDAIEPQEPVTMQVTLSNSHTYRKTGDGSWTRCPTPQIIPAFESKSCHTDDDAKKTDLENLQRWEDACVING